MNSVYRMVVTLLTCALFLYGFGCAKSGSDSGNNTSKDGVSGETNTPDTNTGQPDTNGQPDTSGTTDLSTEDQNTTGKDLSGEDTTPDPGKFGAACNTNSECESGWCVQSKTGYICTKLCLQECPQGFECKAAPQTAPDLIFLCIPILTPLCEGCKDDGQCKGGVCREMGFGTFCTQPCDANDNDKCPSGYKCETVKDKDNNDTKQCVPNNGACDCTEANNGEKHLCKTENQIGTCTGLSTCNATTGWSQCDAPEPEEETCDGKDNDCNGIADDLKEKTKECESDPVQIDGKEVICKGIATCQGEKGWVCDADVPKKEECNNQDDDCDGEIDEDFKDSNGKYYTVQHCGQCGQDCTGLFPNAIEGCDATTYDPPKCVVKECVSTDVEYVKINDFQCVAKSTDVCRECTGSGQCLLAGDKCVNIGSNDGKFYCGRGCNDTNECDVGYECLTVKSVEGDDSKQCVPTSKSCECTQQNAQSRNPLKRSCEKTVNVPNGPTYSCTGTETCSIINSNPGWSTCEVNIPDVCDNQDNNCDGKIDESFKNSDDKYFKVTDCGTCGNSCPTFKPGDNADSICNTTPTLPVCEMKCKTGFFDVDKNPSNGCECQKIGLLQSDPLFDTNTPGIEQDKVNGTDLNCDGVDGDINNAIFVSKNGDDNNPGTIELPKLTIKAGIEAAYDGGSNTKRDVYVATGVYEENVNLRPGVRIYGGFSSDFKQRNIKLYQTVIFGSAPNTPRNPDNLKGSVTCIDINADKGNIDPLILDGFTIFGYDNQTPSGNTYAVYLFNCDDMIEISNNLIIGGKGGDGVRGKDGEDGDPGNPGNPGKDACDTDTRSDLPCPNNTTSRPGGLAVTKTCTYDTIASSNAGPSGKGGTSVMPDYKGPADPPKTALYGEPGLHPTDFPTSKKCNSIASLECGQNGLPGYDQEMQSGCNSCQIPYGPAPDYLAYPWNGTDGKKGQDGVDGDKVNGCTDKLGTVNLSTGEWVGKNGVNGKLGFHGQGGGGGSAGGGVENVQTCNEGGGVFDGTDLGGSGASGGTGGCKGTGGIAGTWGGGSFGIFVIASKKLANGNNMMPLIHDNDIRRGTGGKGGDGGNGGKGGTGGKSALGGKSGEGTKTAWCSPWGGKGGQGGRGGHGSGAGGGCGGVSFGIWANNLIDKSEIKTNEFQDALSGVGGLGGVGGNSLGNKGGNGEQGESNNLNWIP